MVFAVVGDDWSVNICKEVKRLSAWIGKGVNSGEHQCLAVHSGGR
jgi:hypothetical protein